MTETLFYVRPLDTAFFGPPDAQSAGETHFASSLFPPPPRAFQGLVRTRLLQAAHPALDLSDKSRSAQQAVAALVGEPEQLPTGWQIDGPLPVCEDKDKRLTPWMPAPGFLRAADGKKGPLRARFMNLSEEDRALGGVSPERETNASRRSAVGPNLQDGVAGVPGFDERGALGGWISASNMRLALSGVGAWDPSGHSAMPPMVRRESRTGLALEAGTRRAMDHMLYSREDLRFDGRGGFVGKLTAELPTALSTQALIEGTAAFGRGNRLVALEPVIELDSAWDQLSSGEHLPANPDESMRFWMVLLTPVRFDKEFSEESGSVLEPALHGVLGSIRFLGAFLGEPLTLGGYSIAEHRARPNWRYVPAGSCWLFDLPSVANGRRGEILKTLNASHCLGRRDEAAMGFGQVLVGIDRDS
jgi:CRISPR type III-B/RAMP module-associated protein Cmr3